MLEGRDSVILYRVDHLCEEAGMSRAITIVLDDKTYAWYVVDAQEWGEPVEERVAEAVTAVAVATLKEDAGEEISQQEYEQAVQKRLESRRRE